MNPSELPSISIILTGHNEEYCIRDIRSVFEQDYEGPIEIILSDDGSSDGTFAVMQEMAAQYRGPYRLVLNRNDLSLGRGPHIRQAVELASHEWILRQDWDDCSFPWRCSVFARVVTEHPDAVAVVSQMTCVHEEPGVAFEFPVFPVAPQAVPAVALQQGTFSSAAHYGGSMMIRKSACEWGTFLPSIASPMPRFSQVVVLPVPPFWLTMAIVVAFFEIFITSASLSRGWFGSGRKAASWWVRCTEKRAGIVSCFGSGCCSLQGTSAQSGYGQHSAS